MKGQTVKYPPAIKKRVKGDWNCNNCMNLNFSFRAHCNLCGHSKDSPALFSCALYYNTSCLFSGEENYGAGRVWQNLPNVETLVDCEFMKRKTEMYLLNERSINVTKRII